MSFRTRIFLLVMLVTVTAIGATAWLTLSLSSRAIERAGEVADRSRYEIAEKIAAYGLRHGQWSGVDQVALAEAKRTGLHVRLATLDQEVIADTDTMQNLPVGQVRPGPMVIDPRPQLDVGKRQPEPEQPDAGARTDPRYPVGARADAPVTLMLRGLEEFRVAQLTVRCIAVEKPGTPAALAVTEPPYLTPEQVRDHTRCLKTAAAEVRSDEARSRQDMQTYLSCVDVDGDRVKCAAQTFTERVAVTSAVPLQLYLGAPTRATDVGQLTRPAAVGLAGLVLVALLGSALLARGVSRPVRRLTTASLQLAAGVPDVRVPVRGGDELSRLSASFNAMAEAVQRSEERQRRLVADVAHEMRTPLSNLRGYLEGLSDGVVEPSRELFASLHEETMLQRRILDDLQVLALAEAGALNYTRAPLDLAELVGAAATAHRAVAAEAGVAFTVDAPMPAWVTADADRLRQVLGNLLTNAIRYTDAGGHVLLRLRTHGAEAVLTVTDTGVGMSEAEVSRVFDRFFRADPARQRATGGSGLGLTIAHRIVTDHGGRIEVTSEVGRGTTFTVLLPLT